MPIVARESANMARDLGPSRDKESMRTITSEMRSIAAQYRLIVEETRSTIAATRHQLSWWTRYSRSSMFQLRLISINQGSLSPIILTRPT
jgi:hypothetical protein